MRSRSSQAGILFLAESAADPAVAELDPFVQLLRDDGYAVTVTAGTTQAITYLDQHPPPETFIADIQTPKLDAVFVAKYARSQSPLLPVIFVTSYPERMEIAAHGLDPEPLLFTKPLDYRLFSVELRRLTRRNSSSLVIGNVSYLHGERRSKGRG
jgi:CheY-like chemotaxis protein